MLALEPIEPAPLVGARELRRGFLGQVEVGPAAPFLDVVALAAGRQHLGGVLADRVEHHVALLVRALFDAKQALVDERRDTVEDVDADLARRAADAVGHIQLAAADEHGQPVEQPAGAGFEQVVAPRDRPAQRLLALRQVPRARREQREVVLEPGHDLFGRQELDPRGGELDGQRHPVQPRGDPADRRRVGVCQLECGSHRAGTGHEQLGRIRTPRALPPSRCAARPAGSAARAPGGAMGPVASAARARRTPARRRRAARSGWRRGSAGPASGRASRAAPGPRRSPARSCRGRTAPGRRRAPRRCRQPRAGSPCRSRRSCGRSSARPAPVRGPAPAGRTRPRRGSRRQRRPRSAATDASCRCHRAR